MRRTGGARFRVNRECMMMGQVIGFQDFRIYRSCRQIETETVVIQRHLFNMHLKCLEAQALLGAVETSLRQSLACFDASQEQLKAASDYHEKTMRRVNRIMEHSPVFDSLR